MNTPSKALFAALCIAFATGLTACGCGDCRMPSREQKLPSGKTVRVTDLHLAWGGEHEGREPDKDDLEMEFVSANPVAPPQARAAEAREVFELIRPTAELWGMHTAVVSAYPTLQRKGKFDFYVFDRNADGSWSQKHEDRKVFATD